MKEDPKQKRSIRTPRPEKKEKVSLKESRNPKNDETQAEALERLTLKGVKPDRSPNERMPIMKKEYTQPNTLKESKASLKESRNPKNDETQAETLKRVSPNRNPKERKKE